MGGYGSGRSSWRGVLDDCRSLDVNRFQRDGLFSYRSQVTWGWLDEEGNQTASIGIASSLSELVLTYTVDPGGEDEAHLRYPVPIEWTRCHFGGERPWFRCPNRHCQRLAVKLYLHGGYFLCRACTGRAYQCQRETDADRLMRRARRIRRKLGASMNLSEPVWRKPKGMHWRTFERLCAQEEWANRGSLLAVVARFPGMFRGL